MGRAKWQTAVNGIANASSRPNPTLQAQPRYTFNPSANTTPWYLQLFSGFIIETAGKRTHRMDQAQHIAEMNRTNIGQVAWQVRSRLRGHLVTYVGAQQRLASLMSN